MTPIKPFHFGAENDYALLAIFEAWMALTALIEASTSILAEAGFDTAQVTLHLDRGDRALVGLLRRGSLHELRS